MQITDEIGIAIGSYKHNKRIFEVVMIAKGMVIAALVLACFNVIWRFSQELGRRKLQREDELRGFSIPISAIRKGAKQMGKQIDGMDEGWIDMEAYDESDENNNKNGKKKETDKKGNDNDNDDED